MPPVESHTPRMDPFKFTPEEYRRAAMGCRAAAAIAERDAKNQSNPSVAQTFHAESIGYRQLAAKLELAAQRRVSS